MVVPAHRWSLSKQISRNAQHHYRLSGSPLCQTQPSHEQSRTADEQIVQYPRATNFVLTLYSTTTTTHLESDNNTSYDMNSKIPEHRPNLSNHKPEQNLCFPLIRFSHREGCVLTASKILIPHKAACLSLIVPATLGTAALLCCVRT